MPLHMRLPKLRGFKNPFRVEYQVVNLDRLGELFPDGGDVTVDDLVGQGRGPQGRARQDARRRRDRRGAAGDAHAFSASAKDKIAAAGGSATELLATARRTRRPPSPGSAADSRRLSVRTVRVREQPVGDPPDVRMAVT